MTGFRIFARRTTGSGSPPDLQFGEVAYSDTDQQLYVGRAASPPATFSTLPALAPVATSGAYDDLTGRPALFPGNYSDLADIPLVFAPAAHSQAAGTITGLATVATSGVYADLSAKPTLTFGFNYDQTAEPVGPTAGQTWRERSAGGMILGDWEWSGSLWLGNREINHGLVASRASNTSVIYANTGSLNRVVFIESLYWGAFIVAPANATDNWTFDPLRGSFMNAASGAINGTGNLVGTPWTLSLADSWQYQTQVINAAITPIQGGYANLAAFMTRNGSPGAASIVAMLTVRTVRQ